VHLDYNPYIVFRNNMSGKKCSIAGKKYEQLVATTCHRFKSHAMNIPLNTQTNKELGGCSMNQDIYLNFNRERDVGVEVKSITPDWMQMSIVPNVHGGPLRWQPSPKSRIPKEARAMMEPYIRNLEYPIPPFYTSSITYVEWNAVKHEFPDKYIRIPDDSISRAYFSKGSHYIQIKGYGLYHTNHDVCDFGVPFFTCEQYLRVRCKRHGKKDADGKHIPSSVMASLRPKLKGLKRSPYSLDHIDRFPIKTTSQIDL
jgi:hypothetical protein